MIIRTFQEADEYLATQLAAVSHKGEARLTYVRQVLDILGRPQDMIPAIHIAGTSGKGSTAYYAAHLLHESGYKVGLVVSPHVSCVAERAQINGAVLPEVEYCQYLTEFIALVDALRLRLTYVEFLVIFAYWLFAKMNMDYIVIEVGVGGRLDTTNVMSRPDKVAVITDIGFDHTELLGDTLAKIAREKAGIITPNSSVVMYQQGDEIMQVIHEVVAQRGAAFYEIDDDKIDFGVPLPSYQVRNSTLALAAVNCRLTLDGRPPVRQPAIKRAYTCVIPGRFELIDIEGVPTLLDAAHNPQKIRAFTEAVYVKFKGKPIIIVAAFGENKHTTVVDSLKILSGISGHFIATEFTVDGASRGAMKARALGALAGQSKFSVVDMIANPNDALALALRQARLVDGVVAVTGSFYLVGHIKVVCAAMDTAVHSLSSKHDKTALY